MKPFILSFAPRPCMRVLRSTPLNPRDTLCSTEGSSVCEAQLPGPGCRGPHGTSPVSLEEALLVESRQHKHFPGLLEPRQESGKLQVEDVSARVGHQGAAGGQPAQRERQQAEVWKAVIKEVKQGMGRV